VSDLYIHVFFTLILSLYLQPTLFLHGNRSLTLVLLCNTLLDEREMSSIIWLMRHVFANLKTPESHMFT